jgi:hypothetical protein
MELFPTLWENLSRLAGEGRLVSSAEVLGELKRKEGDVVHAWASRHESIFLEPDQAIQEEVARIMADFPKLVDERSGKSFGDPFVIATAAVHSCTVVTEESGGTPERPKIPTVCAARRIQCVRLLDLIRQERWTFR